MKTEYQVFPHPAMDWRLAPDRHTNARLPMKHFSSREEIEARREELRFSLRMAAGLYPWPEKTPLNVRMETVGEYEGYTIKKVMYESVPGFWSTCNMYLPRPLTGKAPAILYCMGHFEEQRLVREERLDVPQQLANFARMGFISLVPDMIGKVDSRQITHDYGRDEMELWQSNGLGVQLWNNIRALDLLCAMDEVDSTRIGMTGCSGGATQTLLTTLVDERIKAAAPINMISLEMQGGCQCENAPGLRRHTENCEMCCMLAPLPLFISGSTGDWTKNQETIEYPVLREAYRHYGAEDKLEHYYQVAGHQYNEKTRKRVYNFFARTLMGKDISWDEQPIEVEDLMALTWFRGEGHAPGFGSNAEFFAAHQEELTRRLAPLSRDEKMKMLRWITGVKDAELFTADGSFFPLDGMTMEHNVAITHGGVQLPFIRLIPDGWDGKRVCLALSGEGKDCLDKPAIRRMLEEGVVVLSGDLFLLGEITPDRFKPIQDAQGLMHFTTFHYTADAYRIQDVALLWKAARETGAECTLWAEGAAARAAACALPFLEDVKLAQLEASALALTGNADYHVHFHVPGIMLAGGIEGCLKLAKCQVERF